MDRDFDISFHFMINNRIPSHRLIWLHTYFVQLLVTRTCMFHFLDLVLNWSVSLHKSLLKLFVQKKLSAIFNKLLLLLPHPPAQKKNPNASLKSQTYLWRLTKITTLTKCHVWSCCDVRISVFLSFFFSW